MPPPWILPGAQLYNNSNCFTVCPLFLCSMAEPELNASAWAALQADNASLLHGYDAFQPCDGLNATAAAASGVLCNMTMALPGDNATDADQGRPAVYELWQIIFLGKGCVTSRGYVTSKCHVMHDVTSGTQCSFELCPVWLPPLVASLATALIQEDNSVGPLAQAKGR